MSACVLAALVVGASSTAGFGRAHAQEAGGPLAPLPPAPPADPRRLALGELLFRDTRLSASGRTSCQSCHDLASNGASARRFDPGDDGRPLPTNSPTVFNSAFAYRLNWEGDIRTMDALVSASFHNPRIMGGALGPVDVRRLDAEPAVVSAFWAAYHRPIDEPGVVNAISVFTRSLTTPGARFDRWLQGDRSALSTQEARGYSDFRRLGCVACHQGADMGGNLMERHGVFSHSPSGSVARLRVPSLRNVAATAPYFHDGGASTLPQAVRDMGRTQLDIDLPPAEVAEIVAFLKTLTGTYRGRPVAAPAGR